MKKPLLILAVAGAVAAPAAAAPVLDVNNLITGTPSAGLYSGQPSPAFPQSVIYQTFTATRSGTLANIDIFGNAAGSGNVYLKVFAGGDQGTPGTTLLGTITRAAAPLSASGVYGFDFSAQNIAIVAGQTYSFSQSADPCDGMLCTIFNNHTVLQGGATSAGYTGGASAVSFNGVFNPAYSTGDLNFRSYVNVAAVPEPASWALMLAGFGLLGATARRRTRSAMLAAA